MSKQGDTGAAERYRGQRGGIRGSEEVLGEARRYRRQHGGVEGRREV